MADTLFDADALLLWAPVEFDSTRERLSEAYRHENGAITYIVYDDDGQHANPRDSDCNLATLIQRNTRCIDVDSDDAGLTEAYDRFGNHRRVGTTERMKRYLSIFRPDIVHYCDYWSAGDSYGWGYITRETWEREMAPPPGPHPTPEAVQAWLTATTTITPEKAFKAEVEVYRQWCEGEVFGGIHEHPDGTSDSCWGFLGYDDHQDIAWHFTTSPITETLYC